MRGKINITNEHLKEYPWTKHLLSRNGEVNDFYPYPSFRDINCMCYGVPKSSYWLPKECIDFTTNAETFIEELV